jgi:hypothetical protein
VLLACSLGTQQHSPLKLIEARVVSSNKKYKFRVLKQFC